MTDRTMPFKCLAASMLFVFGLNSAGFGQNVPLPALDNWMWYNENGWKDIEKRPL